MIVELTLLKKIKGECDDSFRLWLNQAEYIQFGNVIFLIENAWAKYDGEHVSIEFVMELKLFKLMHFLFLNSIYKKYKVISNGESKEFSR